MKKKSRKYLKNDVKKKVKNILKENCLLRKTH